MALGGGLGTFRRKTVQCPANSGTIVTIRGKTCWDDVIIIIFNNNNIIIISNIVVIAIVIVNVIIVVVADGDVT